jgi:hypothetical protein
LPPRGSHPRTTTPTDVITRGTANQRRMRVRRLPLYHITSHITSEPIEGRRLRIRELASGERRRPAKDHILERPRQLTSSHTQEAQPIMRRLSVEGECLLLPSLLFSKRAALPRRGSHPRMTTPTDVITRTRGSVRGGGTGRPDAYRVTHSSPAFVRPPSDMEEGRQVAVSRYCISCLECAAPSHLLRPISGR